MQRSVKVNFAGAPPRQALAGSVVEGVVRLPDLLVGDVVEAPPLREPVPQEPVGVLVGAPLPRLVVFDSLLIAQKSRAAFHS